MKWTDRENERCWNWDNLNKWQRIAVIAFLEDYGPNATIVDYAQANVNLLQVKVDIFGVQRWKNVWF